MNLKLKLIDVLNDVTRALTEDIGTGDVSAELLPAHLMVDAEIISREPMVVCGKAWVDAVFVMINPSVQIEWLVNDGDKLSKPTQLCLIRGSARHILTAERTALNFLQTLSGTATVTSHYVSALNNTSCRLLDTRKTLPGLRYAQKYAVLCGGAKNHRMGLYDAFLIKENHIKACGSITNAIHLARNQHKNLLVEVEVETLIELKEALMAGADRVLLDNFSTTMLIEAVAMNKDFNTELEASGGIELSTIKTIADMGVNYISVGAITKSVRAIDLSLLIRGTIDET